MVAVIHPTAEISPEAKIGEETYVWHGAQVREGAVIGRACILGKGVYIDAGVIIGDNCKIENGVNVFREAVIDDGVFLGPQVMLLNDRYPRAITPDGKLKTQADWQASCTKIGTGAAIGAAALIGAGLAIGKWAMVGAGSVVTRDVPDHGLVVGNPAKLVGFACCCGHRLGQGEPIQESVSLACSRCQRQHSIPTALYLQVR